MACSNLPGIFPYLGDNATAESYVVKESPSSARGILHLAFAPDGSPIGGTTLALDDGKALPAEGFGGLLELFSKNADGSYAISTYAGGGSGLTFDTFTRGTHTSTLLYGGAKIDYTATKQ